MIYWCGWQNVESNFRRSHDHWPGALQLSKTGKVPFYPGARQYFAKTPQTYGHQV